MNSALWQLAAWTMIHSLWLGAAVALVGGMVRLAARRAAPNTRYALSLATLATFAMAPLAAAAWLSVNGVPVVESTLLPPPGGEGWGGGQQLVRAPRHPSLTLPIEGMGPEELILAARPQGSVADPAPPVVIDLAHATPAELEALATPLQPAPTSPTTSSSFPVLLPPSALPLSPPLSHELPVPSRLLNLLPILWLIGAPLTFILLAAGLIGSERLRRRAVPILAGPAHDACERLRHTLKISRRVALAACDEIAQPILVGIVRPLILLPTAALAGWTPDELDMVLLHELAHVRRWDNLVNLLQRIVESLLFFHPAVWLLSRQVRRDREECCDAAVVARIPEPTHYADLLVTIASRSRHSGRTPSLAVASAMATHPLAGRIRRILNLEEEPMRITRRTLAATLLLPLLLAGAIFFNGANAEDADALPSTPDAEQPSKAEGLQVAGAVKPLIIELPAELRDDVQLNRIVMKLVAAGHEHIRIFSPSGRPDVTCLDVTIPATMNPRVVWEESKRGKYCRIIDLDAPITETAAGTQSYSQASVATPSTASDEERLGIAKGAYSAEYVIESKTPVDLLLFAKAVGGAGDHDLQMKVDFGPPQRWIIVLNAPEVAHRSLRGLLDGIIPAAPAPDPAEPPRDSGNANPSVPAAATYQPLRESSDWNLSAPPAEAVPTRTPKPGAPGDAAALLNKIVQLEAAIAKTQAEFGQLEVFKELALQRGGNPALDAAVARELDGDPLIAEYKQQLARLQSTLEAQNAKSGDKSAHSAAFQRARAMLQQTEADLDRYRQAAERSIRQRLAKLPNATRDAVTAAYDIRRQWTEKNLAKYSQELLEAQASLTKLGVSPPQLASNPALYAQEFIVDFPLDFPDSQPERERIRKGLESDGLVATLTTVTLKGQSRPVLRVTVPARWYPKPVWETRSLGNVSQMTCRIIDDRTVAGAAVPPLNATAPRPNAAPASSDSPNQAAASEVHPEQVPQLGSNPTAGTKEIVVHFPDYFLDSEQEQERIRKSLEAGGFGAVITTLNVKGQPRPCLRVTVPMDWNPAPVWGMTKLSNNVKDVVLQVYDQRGTARTTPAQASPGSPNQGGAATGSPAEKTPTAEASPGSAAPVQEPVPPADLPTLSDIATTSNSDKPPAHAEAPRIFQEGLPWAAHELNTLRSNANHHLLNERSQRQKNRPGGIETTRAVLLTDRALLELELYLKQNASRKEIIPPQAAANKVAAAELEKLRAALESERQPTPPTANDAIAPASSSKFPTFEQQQIADRAWRLFGVDFEPLQPAELERVKKLGYAGGVRVGKNEGGGSNLPPDDLLVGLHAWPVTSMESLGAILNRDDLGDLAPLKFYVIRNPERDGHGAADPANDKVVTGRLEIFRNVLAELQDEKSRRQSGPPATVAVHIPSTLPNGPASIETPTPTITVVQPPTWSINGPTKNHSQTVAYLKISFLHSSSPFGNADSRPTAQEIERLAKNHIALIQSPAILAAALSAAAPHDVAVDRNSHKVELLRRRLTATFPGEGEIMELKLTGGQENEDPALLQAIIDAFVKAIDAPPTDSSRLIVPPVSVESLVPSATPELAAPPAATAPSVIDLTPANRMAESRQYVSVRFLPTADAESLSPQEKETIYADLLKLAKSSQVLQRAISSPILSASPLAQTPAKFEKLLAKELHVTYPNDGDTMEFVLVAPYTATKEVLETIVRAFEKEAASLHPKVRVGVYDPSYSPYISDPRPSVQKTTFLYDGKTFEQWRDLWKLELKPERRAESMNALAAFGRAGRGQDAVNAILEVASASDLRAGAGEDQAFNFLHAAKNALSSLPLNDSLPLLIERLRQSEGVEREFFSELAQQVLGTAYSDPQSKPLLLEIAKQPELGLEEMALVALIRQDQSLEDEDILALVRQSLSHEAPSMLVLRQLGFQRLDKIPEQFELIFHPSPDVQKQVWLALSQAVPALEEKDRKAIAERLLETLENPKRRDDQVAAIRAMSVSFQSFKRPDLTEQTGKLIGNLKVILEKGSDDLILPAIVALSRLTASSEELVVRDAGVSDARADLLRQLLPRVDEERQQLSPHGSIEGQGGGFF